MKDSKIFLVVGGSEGIGFSIVEQLSKKPCVIIIASRSKVKLESARDKLEGSRASIHIYSLDATKLSDLKKMEKYISETHGNVSTLINCVGFCIPDFFENLSIEDYESQLKINLYPAIYLTKVFLEQLLTHKQSYLIHTSSILGFMSTFGFSAYSSSKFALVGFCEAIYSEYRVKGLNVSVLCPPSTVTPGFELENKKKPKEILDVETLIPPVSADFVAKSALNAIEAKKFMIIPSKSGKLLYLISRYFPALLRFFSKRKIF